MRPNPSATWRWACYSQLCLLWRPKRHVALGSVQSIKSVTMLGGARAFQAPGGARVFLSGTWRFGCHSQSGLAKTPVLGALGSAPGMSIPGIGSHKCLTSDRRNGRWRSGLTLTSDRPSTRWCLAQPLASDRPSARWHLGLTIVSDRLSTRWRLGQPLHRIAQAQGGA